MVYLSCALPEGVSVQNVACFVFVALGVAFASVFCWQCRCRSGYLTMHLRPPNAPSPYRFFVFCSRKKACIREDAKSSPSPMGDQEFRDFLADHVILEDEPAPLRSKGAEKAVTDAFEAFDQVRVGDFDSPNLSTLQAALSFSSLFMYLSLSLDFLSWPFHLSYLVVGFNCFDCAVGDMHVFSGSHRNADSSPRSLWTAWCLMNEIRQTCSWFLIYHLAV